MKTKSQKIKLMTLSAIMAALYVGLDFLAVSVSAPLGGSMKISISALPVIIVAIIGGPVWGAATGFVGAFLGQMVTYGFTPMTLLWVLPAVARGLTVGLFYKAFKYSDKTLHLILYTCISSVIVTFFNTVAQIVDFMVYGAYYPGAPDSYIAVLINVPQRLIAGLLTAVVLSLMLPAIIPPVKKIVNK